MIAAQGSPGYEAIVIGLIKPSGSCTASWICIRSREAYGSQTTDKSALRHDGLPDGPFLIASTSACSSASSM